MIFCGGFRLRPYFRTHLVTQRLWLELASWRRGPKEWAIRSQHCWPVGFKVLTPMLNCSVVADWRCDTVTDRGRELQAERGRDYGPMETNHVGIGMHWGAILYQAYTSGRWRPGLAIPPELSTLMMSCVKINREAYRHKADNIDDGQNYLRFTGELSETLKNDHPPSRFQGIQ